MAFYRINENKGWTGSSLHCLSWSGQWVKWLKTEIFSRRRVSNLRQKFVKIINSI